MGFVGLITDLLGFFGNATAGTSLYIARIQLCTCAVVRRSLGQQVALHLMWVLGMCRKQTFFASPHPCIRFPAVLLPSTLSVDCTSCLCLLTLRSGLPIPSYYRLLLPSLRSATMDPLHDDVLDEALADTGATDEARDDRCRLLCLMRVLLGPSR